MKLEELERVNQEQIRHAGARYTPGIDPDAPNLQIEHIVEAFDALAYSEELKERLLGLAEEAESKWARAPEATYKAFKGRVQTPLRVAELCESIAARSPADDRQELHQLIRATRYALGRVREVGSSLRDDRSETEDKDKQRRLGNSIAQNSRLESALRDVSAFVEGPSHSLLGDAILFLQGEWGTGKTHLLCDLTENRMERELPTLLLLAESLPDAVDPLEGVCRRTKLAESPQKLLKGLESLGQQADKRALLIFDGINEGDREQWRSSLVRLAGQAKHYPHVGMAVSCRTPFDRQIVNSQAEDEIVRVIHHGFEDQEVDAQVEFFDYYNIPAPHVPLLVPEFSRPLFLKILCKAIADSEVDARGDYLRSIASGQRGMTDVLEQFAKEVGRSIENDLGLDRRTCWQILKGVSTGTSNGSGIAGRMAENLRNFIGRDEAVNVIQEQTQLSETDSRDLLERMISDGLLAEALYWDQEALEVIRFPYQRFGDHIIARHLLAEYLNTNTKETIRRSFYINRPLGEIFGLAGGETRFNHPGLAAALMLEFPERVKRVLDHDERELFWYLPKKRRRAGPVKEAFLEGLHWRNTESFGQDTATLLNFFLHRGDHWTQVETLDVLVGLATRPGHPYSAKRLYNYLAKYDMPDRDLMWSEYLRHSGDASPTRRLVTWIETTDLAQLSNATARNTIRLLSTFLTATVRRFRDRVTRGLYLVGLYFPRVLFDQTVKSLDFSDPYVPERMLASSYGVAMSLWADPQGGKLRQALPGFGNALLRKLFEPSAEHGTKHILMRQYAQGTIELANKVDSSSLSDRMVDLSADPLDQIPAPFREPDNIQKKEIDEVEPAFHMDFRNYTIGGLVPGRGNYDSEHVEYQDVVRQIMGRVYDLGYSYERFETVDRRIGRQYHSRRANGSKTDRYGKKYSWIAYFEMYGTRSDKGVLSEWDEEVHPSDADIDPSFPTSPPEWEPELPDVFASEYSGPVAWLSEGPDPDYRSLIRREKIDGVTGPWLLLDGYIDQGALDPRRVFTFLRAVMLPKSEVDRFEKLFRVIDYPGNRHIPEAYDDHYTYAGEIPWSDRFGPTLRGDDGSGKRNIQKALRLSYEGQSSGVEVEVPSHQYSWESYHSEMNQVSGVYFPAPAVCDRLNLINHSRTLDLFDSDDNQASVYRTFHPSDAVFPSRLLYMRADLIDDYIESTEQTIIWTPWGERQLKHDEFQANEEIIARPIRNYEHVHKDLVHYAS